jgi:hypothetical protein
MPSLLRSALALVLVSSLAFLSIPAHAQTGEPPPIMMNWEPPPIIHLEKGLLSELGWAREGKHPIQLTAEGDGERMVGIILQTTVMRNGEKMTSDSRPAVIWPSGDQMMCPGTWGILSTLHEASEKDRLPSGEYEVQLAVTSDRGEPLGDPVAFQFEVEK